MNFSGAAASSGWIIILVYVGFFALMFYVMLIPQRKADKKKKELLSTIKNGDEIVTIGGILGKIVSVREKDITIQLIDDKAKIRIEKWAIKEVKKRAEEAKYKKIEKTEDVNVDTNVEK